MASETEVVSLKSSRSVLMLAAQSEQRAALSAQRGSSLFGSQWSLRRREPNRLPPARRQNDRQIRIRVHRPLADRDRQRIRRPVRTRSVGVYLRSVLPSRRQEIQRHVERPALFVRDRAEEPVIGILRLTRDDYVVADAAVDSLARLPINGDVTDELECRPVLVVLRQVSRHL